MDLVILGVNNNQFIFLSDEIQKDKSGEATLQGMCVLSFCTYNSLVWNYT